MKRYGMELTGMEWNGMEWNEMEWNERKQERKIVSQTERVHLPRDTV